MSALYPLLRLGLDLPDRRHFEKLVRYPPGGWSTAKDHADVRLGENRFTGDLHWYRIQATAEEISVDVTLTRRGMASTTVPVSSSVPKGWE